MSVLAALLLGLGVADLVVAPDGDRPSRRAVLGSAGGSFVAAVLLLLANGGSGARSVLIASAVGAAAAAWLLVRVPAGGVSLWHRPMWILVALVAALTLAALADVRWLGSGSQPLGPSWWLLVLGLSQIGTGNAIVRLVLRALEEPDDPAPPAVGHDAPDGVAEGDRDDRPLEDELRGGRFIGPLERLLIFGLAVAGQATAAVVVASVKSLLRFPELAQARAREERAEPGVGTRWPRRIDYLTEYLVVGSLSSWLVALAAAGAFHLIVRA